MKQNAKEEVEYKALGFDIELKEEGESKDGFLGSFKASASTFRNVDVFGDVMEEGVFDSVLAKADQTGKMPKLFKQHFSHDIPGILNSMKVDKQGLKIQGSFIDTTLGRDTRVEVKTGALTDMSIGFITKDFEEPEKGKVKRIIKDIDLIEVSFVTFPANPKANVISAKGAPQTERDMERLLRQMGFSQTEAKRFIAEGFKSHKDIQRDVEEPIDSGTLSLLSLKLQVMRQKTSNNINILKEVI